MNYTIHLCIVECQFQMGIEEHLTCLCEITEIMQFVFCTAYMRTNLILTRTVETLHKTNSIVFISLLKMCTFYHTLEADGFHNTLTLYSVWVSLNANTCLAHQNAGPMRHCQSYVWIGEQGMGDPHTVHASSAQVHLPLFHWTSQVQR